jgi:hypothetical protein
MANSIKNSGGGLALQVTKPARSGDLVEEDAEDRATYRADVVVYGFDDLLFVVDDDRVSMADRAELVATAVRDSGGIHRGATASIEIAGNGYQVQLQGCRAAGFHEGDRSPAVARQGVLFIHDGDQRRLVRDLAAIREEQLG